MDIPPNHTIYIKNLNERISEDELKEQLYQVFCEFGDILAIHARKTVKMRGQAFIVFKQIKSARNALMSKQGKSLFGKVMEIQYSRSESYAISALKGIPKPSKPSEDEKEEAEFSD